VACRSAAVKQRHEHLRLLMENSGAADRALKAAWGLLWIKQDRWAVRPNHRALGLTDEKRERQLLKHHAFSATSSGSSSIPRMLQTTCRT
jgi:hypothetical protein